MNNPRNGDTVSEFIYQKKGSSVWYYRRRYPKPVAALLGKAVFMQSLKTHSKREAQKVARRVSVQFDDLCAEVLRDAELAKASTVVGIDEVMNSAPCPASTPEEVLATLPDRVRVAAQRVIEEQQRDPTGWRETALRWRDLYESQVTRPLGLPGPSLGAEAQASLRGIDAVLRGETLPEFRQPAQWAGISSNQEQADADAQSWEVIRDDALAQYKDSVSAPRYEVARRVLSLLRVRGTSERAIKDALREHSKARLQKVQPRTVRGQQDAAVAAIRKVIPAFKPNEIRELKGVMQPNVGDRDSIPVDKLRAALECLVRKRPSAKVRNGYEGGASQFDGIAMQTLAFTGMRPRELIQARPSSLVTKADVFGSAGLFLRLWHTKNKASRRDIPLSDGVRSVVDTDRLREFLEWLEQNFRSVPGLVSSMGTRFKRITNGHTQYQIRHTWADVARHAGVEQELRERMQGHAIGIAGVYGSGIPLAKGLDAMLAVKRVILGKVGT
ncbi:MAG: hypothetical protein PHG21_01455 [Azoarcus sp.]|nr:hypothetical protein [Azoarcus sp.]